MEALKDLSLAIGEASTMREIRDRLGALMDAALKLEAENERLKNRIAELESRG